MTIGAPVYYPAGPIAIRDATIARVKAMTGFTNVYGQRVLPTKDTQLPFACVWHAGDRTEPCGDANTGAPSFDHTLLMAVSIVVRAATQAGLDAPIVDLVERLRATLLTDPTWISLLEGCERCDATYDYPEDGNGLYARGTVEFALSFRSEWPPYLPNELLEIDTFIKGQAVPVQVISFEGTP